MSKLILSLSQYASKYIGILVILISLFAFLSPSMFEWATTYTSLLLGFAMFGMGMTINANDFKNILRHPKDVFIGCLAQFLVMPLISYLLAVTFNLPTPIAIGVILVGCCPGGTASNIITHIAGGDTTLSVSMTVVSTLLCPILTPLWIYLLAGQWVDVSILSMITSVVKVVLVPIILGIIINYKMKNKKEYLSSVMPLISVVSVLLLIAGIVATNKEQLLICGSTVFIIIILHNVIGMILGFTIAKLFKMDLPKSTAVCVEVGMQNSGLAVSLALSNFATQPLCAVPGAIFSIWHNISGGILASIMKKRSEDNNINYIAEFE
ncbi:MAG: bile acid:sodium symporter family protein [Terrisporobacter othiniensis]|uniref:bile acid:sodium symporter family protein n=1 Tax=Terrisporobacter othiniensis TaxID=1577792 RepID=UPI0029080B9D|nr:bile acid:sodium symporter family protein [Terrisporobacter othiniensis]MDU6983709.1 bile acid:sodium symporter family protein [Terrisporobacter othiniensis]